METPDGLRYSSDHEWVRVDGDVAFVGITDFAQDSLGDIVFVQLPEAGDPVTAGGSVCEVESTKSVSDIYAPVTGVVHAANDLLNERPELLNADPYGDGWIFSVTMSAPAEVEALLDAAGYRRLVEGS